MIQENQLLSHYSTLNIGGPARFFLEAASYEEIKEGLRFADEHKIPFFVLGKGSNCLFDDRGYNGLVILNKIHYLKYLPDQKIDVSAGYSFSLLGAQTAKQGLKGLEFASGIPGSIGGAVYMNAGANGALTQDRLESVRFLSAAEDLEVFQKNDLEFGNRFSTFHQKKGVILSAIFQLEKCELAREKQLSLIQYRLKTQPYSEKSAGCVFRNPAVQGAGALIDRCGLKGLRIGDAEVSTLHANFFINKGQARSADMLALIDHVQKIVLEKTGHSLEMEVRYVPYDV